ncbi:MAG TPA: YdeI/OmpD-associated family protein [Candidatus Limnocylindrales bacterium]|nr:YdeI/OmpD-associated family protein [Candidatus Limnocylindrales bacterium]
MARFRTTILQTGKSTFGFVIPPAVVESLGAGKRPPVTVTINGYTYRNTVAVMGGDFMIGVSSEHRGPAGVTGGEEVEVDLALDTAPRVVTVPGDLAAALDAEPAARATFDRLSYSNRSWHVLQVEAAKTDETRQRRIAKSVDALREGRIR